MRRTTARKANGDPLPQHSGMARARRALVASSATEKHIARLRAVQLSPGRPSRLSSGWNPPEARASGGGNRAVQKNVIGRAVVLATSRKGEGTEVEKRRRVLASKAMTRKKATDTPG